MRWIPKRLPVWTGVMVLAAAGLAQAGIPYRDHTYSFQQPNGEVLKVTIEGNDYYAEQRTADGSLVVYDAARKGLCYARLNATGDDLVSTGVLATNARVRANVAGQPREPGLDAATRARKALERRQQLLGEVRADGRVAPRAAVAPLAATGAIKGLTVLIQFPDVAGTIGKAEVESFLNAVPYSGFGNAQSVRGYFQSVSGGKLDYTNTATTYYTAKYPKSYYTDGSIAYPQRAQELMMEALNWLKSTGYNFSGLSTDSNGRILGLNFFYAGETNSAWSTGLWPHMGGFNTSFCSSGVCAGKYQISNMSSALSIGTFVHETGHLVMGWPDLYDYDGSSQGSMGGFDVMGVGSVGAQSKLRPVPPNGYFRLLAGWDSAIELNPAINASAPKGRLSASNGAHTLYRWSNPANPKEAFYVEAIQKAGQNTWQPDEGLMVFHVDPAGNNSDEWHPYIQLEHADARRDPEYNRNSGDSTDLYDGVTYKAFDDVTPNSSTSRGTNAKWWNATNSGFKLANIGTPGATIGFDVGASVPPGETTTGTLSDRQTKVLPWFQYAGGTITITLSGPGAPVDFDMKLDKWNGSAWVNVASSTGPTTSEKIVYNAGSGYYQITVYSYSGAGTYTLTVAK